MMGSLTELRSISSAQLSQPLSSDQLPLTGHGVPARRAG